MDVVREEDITCRLDTSLDEMMDEFADLPVCGRDIFECKMNEVKRAGTRSERPSRLRALFDLFEQCGIPYEKHRENEYYEELIKNADIPTCEELEDRMIGTLFARYEKYPAPREYMERLVNSLSSPEDGWQNDTLRLRILKQFLKYGDISNLRTAGIGGKKTIVDYVKNKRDALWQKAMEQEAQEQKAQEDEIRKDGMTSEEIASELGSQKKVSQKNGAQRRRARRKRPTGAPTLEEILALVDDGVFYCLPGASREERRPNGPYGILKIADDLAYGKFRTEGATRKTLYQFAMVYGMTYYSGNEKREDYRADKKDVEKNLFEDYYSNNLMRFITAAYRNNLSEFEINPSGQGINYKNFAEVIYLYFIASKHTGPEKMRLSAEMIRRVTEKQRESGRRGLERKTGRTKFYREMAGRIPKGRKDRFCGRDIFAMDEEEFEKFICENYDCNTRARSCGSMQMETEQASAAKVYADILKELQAVRAETEPSEKSPDFRLKQNYGLWYTDLEAYGKEGADKGLETYRDRFPKVNEEKFDEFLELLRATSNFVKVLPEPSPETVTRTAILTAYYYLYNAKHEDDTPGRWNNFRELYADFKSGIDEKLEDAYYLPLSGKNLFDVLVVLSSFAYINL
ncbi:MAG: hypothetical protein LUI87_13380 [Lachnospiraceae bacterium]|nr:hypothetical protein [Lachnospiraceae bacterium]